MLPERSAPSIENNSPKSVGTVEETHKKLSPAKLAMDNDPVSSLSNDITQLSATKSSPNIDMSKAKDMAGKVSIFKKIATTLSSSSSSSSKT